jgi:hypothetical protein
LLAPVPHGAPVRRTDSRALRVPSGIGLELVALARFQLMAALGLARVVHAVSVARAVCVVGGGPVAWWGARIAGHSGSRHRAPR